MSRKGDYRPVEDVLLLNTAFCPITGCWIWSGYRYPRGYGKACFGGRYVSAHRLSYVVNKGPIPEGLVIDHLCRNILCVNPDHLEAVTMRENVLRGVGLTAVNNLKTHCVNGHCNWEYRVRNNGRIRRACIDCLKNNSKRYIAEGRRKEYFKNYRLQKRSAK